MEKFFESMNYQNKLGNYRVFLQKYGEESPDIPL